MLEVIMHFYYRCMRCSKPIPLSEEFCAECLEWLKRETGGRDETI